MVCIEWDQPVLGSHIFLFYPKTLCAFLLICAFSLLPQGLACELRPHLTRLSGTHTNAHEFKHAPCVIGRENAIELTMTQDVAHA